MKKINIIGIVWIAILCATLLVVGNSMAADLLIDAELVDVSQHVDKNGAKYTRAIIKEQRELGGVSYSDTVAVMGFGEMAAPLATYKAGERLQAVVGANEYQGRTSYTVKGFVAD